MQLALKKNTGCWEVQSQQIAWRLTQARQEILELFRREPGACTVQGIAETLGKKKTNVANMLAKLVNNGSYGSPITGFIASWGAPALPGRQKAACPRKAPGMTVAEIDAALEQKLAKLAKQLEAIFG